MSEQTDIEPTIDLKAGITEILSIIEQEREREIITRRFGLYDRRETLEQIGELLGITRERVRQLEKAILIRLKIAAEDGKIESVTTLEKVFIRNLTELGRIARVQDLTSRLLAKTADQRENAHIAFIAELAPGLTVIGENDSYFHAVGIRDYGDEKKIRTAVDEIVKTIKKHGQPLTIEQLHDHKRRSAEASVAAMFVIRILPAGGERPALDSVQATACVRRSP